MKKGKYFVHIKDGKLAFDKNIIFSDNIIITNDNEKKFFTVNQRSYKGKLRISIEDGNILVINDIPLETYLESVVPTKVMPIWPDEAIKAQAVAARTYALYSKMTANTSYDLKATDSELRYLGTGKEIEKNDITKLVQATAGEYLVDNYGRPINAISTSSSGGRTEAVEGFAYLQSVKDFDEDSPDNKWEKRVSPFILQNYLEQGGHAIGKLKSILLSPMNEKGSDRSISGRVRYLIVTGDKGSAKLSGEEIAKLMDLPSSLFDLKTGVPAPEKMDIPVLTNYGYEVGSKEMPIKVNESDKPVWSDLRKAYHLIGDDKEEQLTFKGKARGHGCGLSSWGARGMANADEKTKYKDILKHYYPGTTLIAN
ncbi:MAG: SpoIID/LytB domain-containing protein [Phascolarctobacterium sp.]|nr:SpoIID/LytB domain-containing protein [Phascolarctobacterium sp.]